MSSTNGEHNRGRNGKPAPRSPVVQRAIDEAVREARKRVEERDPLGDNAPGIMPKLLIGLQRSYDPTTREPDHTLLPEDDPERLAYERGELKSLLESERYKKTLQQLDEIDVEDGFNLEDD